MDTNQWWLGGNEQEIPATVGGKINYAK
jgi:hypothetical protein